MKFTLFQQQAEEITERADKSPAYMYKKMLLLQKQKNERKQLRYAEALHLDLDLRLHSFQIIAIFVPPNYDPIWLEFDSHS